MTPHGMLQRLQSWRLLPVIAAAGAGVLLLAGVIIGLSNEQLYRTQKVEQVLAQARILAASETAALAFDDRATAQEYLNALSANPDVETASLYDPNRRQVAFFSRGEVSPPRTAPAEREPGFEHGRVVVVLPVREGASVLGSVFLETTRDRPAGLFARHAGLALLLIMASLLTGVLGAAQSTLRRANEELGSRAEDLAEANTQLQFQMEEREKAEEALRQSQKMEAIGQLTGGVAHDFNNILMVASSGLDLLDRTEDPARRQMLKDGIRQAVDRGVSLTRQLLTISRRSALQPQVIDLKSQIDGMRVLLERSLREDITVVLELADELWAVEVDPSQLEVALLNIAVNARDAMPDGGAITVRAGNVADIADGDLAGDHVCLAVSDTGLGMPREVLRRIFEPFYTTKGVGKGTGLGLSQVYGFAHASGGDVRVDSAPGKGTTVSLYLPRSAHQPKLVEAPVPRKVSRTRTEGRALLVEDDDSVAALVSEMLSEVGYAVQRAPTAAVALNMLSSDSDFDVVLSDMVMPGRMNGIELAREVARRWPALPLVLTTGFSEAAAAATQEGYRLLVKPYRLEALASTLEAARKARRAA